MENICLYCGRPGYFIANCPLKEGACQQVRSYWWALPPERPPRFLIALSFMPSSSWLNLCSHSLLRPRFFDPGLPLTATTQPSSSTFLQFLGYIIAKEKPPDGPCQGFSCLHLACPWHKGTVATFPEVCKPLPALHSGTFPKVHLCYFRKWNMELFGPRGIQVCYADFGLWGTSCVDLAVWVFLQHFKSEVKRFWICQVECINHTEKQAKAEPTEVSSCNTSTPSTINNNINVSWWLLHSLPFLSNHKNCHCEQLQVYFIIPSFTALQIGRWHNHKSSLASSLIVTKQQCQWVATKLREEQGEERPEEKKRGKTRRGWQENIDEERMKRKRKRRRQRSKADKIKTSQEMVRKINIIKWMSIIILWFKLVSIGNCVPLTNVLIRLNLQDNSWSGHLHLLPGRWWGLSAHIPSRDECPPPRKTNQ